MRCNMETGGLVMIFRKKKEPTAAAATASEILKRGRNA
jgi:hypothetical protein